MKCFYVNISKTREVNPNLLERRAQMRCRNVIELFMHQPENIMVLTMEPGDGYKNSIAMTSAYRCAVRRTGYDIRVVKEGDSIILVKGHLLSERVNNPKEN